MSYMSILKKGGDSMLSNLKEKIGRKRKIYTNDIQYCIRHHDMKITALLLDNIPKSEYFCSFYGAAVKGNKSREYIKFLYDYGVPLNDSELIAFCIKNKKMDHADYFVSLNKDIIDELSVISFCDSQETFKYLMKLLKTYNIKLKNMEVICYGIYNTIDYKNVFAVSHMVNTLCRQQNFDISIFHETDAEELQNRLNALHDKSILRYFTDTTSVSTKLLELALKYDTDKVLEIALLKYRRKIPSHLIKTATDSRKQILIDHNKKFKHSNVVVTYSSYSDILAQNEDNMMDKLREKIEREDKIQMDDIYFAIEIHDMKVISLLLDNTPKSDYYCSFYEAIVSQGRPHEYIDLLYKYGVPLDNSFIITFNLPDEKHEDEKQYTERLNYIEKFVSLNTKLINVTSVSQFCKREDLFEFLLELLEKYKIKIENMELTYYNIVNNLDDVDILSSAKILETLCNQQQFDTSILDLIDKDEMDNKLKNTYYDSFLKFCAERPHVDLETIICSLGCNKIEPLKIVLSRLKCKIPDEIIGKGSVEQQKLMKEYNKKFGL